MSNDVPISIGDLFTAANSLLISAETAYAAELSRQHQQVADAVHERSGLADGYWKQAHVARLRYQSALALNEALSEIVADLEAVVHLNEQLQAALFQSQKPFKRPPAYAENLGAALA